MAEACDTNTATSNCNVLLTVSSEGDGWSLESRADINRPLLLQGRGIISCNSSVQMRCEHQVRCSKHATVQWERRIDFRNLGTRRHINCVDRTGLYTAGDTCSTDEDFTSHNVCWVNRPNR